MSNFPQVAEPYRLPWNQFNGYLRALREMNEAESGDPRAKVEADLRRMLNRGGRRVFR